MSLTFHKILQIASQLDKQQFYVKNMYEISQIFCYAVTKLPIYVL